VSGLDTIPLLVELGGERQALVGWRRRWEGLDAGLAQGYLDPDLDDSRWESAGAPELLGATRQRDSLWYRVRFDWQPGRLGSRVLLRFGGACYEARVYLNGAELGRHEGYFAPFGFDVTERLRPGDNVLAACVHTAVEADDLAAKRQVLGIYADWDCKPYPSHVFGHLPEPYRWEVPVGLWRPVELLACGPVVATHVHAFPRASTDRWVVCEGRLQDPGARVALRLGLRNLSGEPQALRLEVEATPASFAGRERHVAQATARLGPAEAREVDLELPMPDPALWWPWTHGEPCLYRLRVALRPDGGPACGFERRLGFREVSARWSQEGQARGWTWHLNGRRIFPKGSNYAADFWLHRTSAASYRRDLELARAANLDLIRVHGHLEAEACYELADELGMLVWCDFPLSFGYLAGVSPEQQASFARSVRAQAAEMVHLLQTHPSVVLWCLHNEPPWATDRAIWMREEGAAAIRAVDHEAAALVAALDPSRPTLPASGDVDEHLYHGWYVGSLADVAHLAPTHPTEFGAQALPSIGSPVWLALNANWPVDAEDPGWLFAGYQPLQWASQGVGAPREYASLAAYVEASQAYQASLIREYVAQLRIKKLRPTGGFIHHSLTDVSPSITWAVLDYARQPKAGYAALREACRPTVVALAVESPHAFDRLGQLICTEPEVRIRPYLVNDDPRRRGTVAVRWSLRLASRWPSAASWRGRLWARLGDVLRRLMRRDRGRWSGGLPAFDAPALALEPIVRRLPEGAYRLDLALMPSGGSPVTTELAFRVGGRGRCGRRLLVVPSVVGNRFYQRGSLRREPGGWSFALRNRYYPGHVTRLLHLRVDGAMVPLAEVELVVGGKSHLASSVRPDFPLHVGLEQVLTVRVRGQAPEPGPHELDLAAELQGLAGVLLRVGDRLRAE